MFIFLSQSAVYFVAFYILIVFSLCHRLYNGIKTELNVQFPMIVIAQWLEHVFVEQVVLGSIPSDSYF